MDFEYIVITLNRGYNTYDTYVMDARHAANQFLLR
jgi:hypothetical protein